MIRGTTPTFTFTADISFSNFDKIEVTFGQRKRPILTKTKDDCTINGTELSVTLTEEESFMFDCTEPKFTDAYTNELQIQLVCAKGSAVVATDILNGGTVETLLKGACLN